MQVNPSLQEVLSIPDERRDSSWEVQFFHTISQESLEIIELEPKSGPDGWPYLLAKTGHGASEPFSRILHWLSDKGIGLVVNPQKEYPDYVFTYGMLWHFRETGLFYGEASKPNEGVFQFQVKDIKMAGEPTKEFLPDYVRKVIREFLLQQGVLAPRILVFTLDEKNFELAFSKESLGDPDSTEHQGVLEALAWFLPPHYQIALISEKELPMPFVSL